MKTTQWSVVLAAGGEGEGARAALEQLCRTYRQPAYAFIRRQRQPEDALELTQEFFTQVLERRDLARLDPVRGRFRSWLLGSLQHFLSNDWARRTAARRDERKLLWLEGISAEQRFLLEPRVTLDPERCFDQGWALALLEQVVGLVAKEYGAPARARFFAAARPLVLPNPDPDERSHGEIAETLGMTALNFRQQVFRLRYRYRVLLRREIAQTLAPQADPSGADVASAIDEELAFLQRALDAGRD